MASGAEPAPVDAGLNDWAPPPRRAPTSILHLQGFDGPADLLLDLAKRQRIGLGVMSVLALAEQFADAVERQAGTVPIERRADWLVVAARLVLLRARLLFPATPAVTAKAERDAAQALRRLEAMAFARAAPSWLQARPLLGVDVFARAPGEAPKWEGGYVALMETCRIWRARPSKPRRMSVVSAASHTRKPGDSAITPQGPEHMAQRPETI